ncbi:hypothetical protein CFSAN001075_13723 [Salmonella enterica subsp. enterica serovar Hartford str. CFSAN001075]|nr:hypothetical protein CFSAN001075_13723 [Salmonella enterica subsp. enterica serovar Hartford str. CFSAN001075]
MKLLVDLVLILLTDPRQILTGQNRRFCQISTGQILMGQILMHQILMGQILMHQILMGQILMGQDLTGEQMQPPAALPHLADKHWRHYGFPDVWLYVITSRQLPVLLSPF